MKILAPILLLLVVGQAYASETVSGVCFGCDRSAKSRLAVNWAATHLSREDARQDVRQRYRVLDPLHESAVTFEVYKTADNAPMVEEVEPNPETRQKANSLFVSRQSLASTLDAIEIPASVVEDPWAFTGCTDCITEITAYLNSHDEISTRLMSIQDAQEALNIVDGSLNQEWVLTLEAGGKVHLDLTLEREGESSVADIQKVIDRNNNTVPLDPSRLSDGLALQGSMSYYDKIQHHLASFGYRFEERHGRIRISGFDKIEEP